MDDDRSLLYLLQVCQVLVVSAGTTGMPEGDQMPDDF